jgi:type 1 glutamine amidotransferase
MGQAGERQFHNQPEHWELLAGNLRSADLATRVISDDLSAMTDANLGRFDAILNFSTDLVASDAQMAALTGAVRAGAGFVGLHAATATFRESQAYHELVGSRFARHPPIKRFMVDILDSAHPVTAGIDSFEVEDERYELKDELPGSRIVATAEGFPSVYVREFGRGRVCYIAIGHDRRCLALPHYARLVHQAIAWVARREIGGIQP